MTGPACGWPNVMRRRKDFMYKRHLIILIAAFMLVLHASTSVIAKTVYCSNCSNQFVQALERATSVEQLNKLASSYLEDVKQTAQQIELVKNNLEQLANMVQNTISLPETLLSQAKQNLNQLANITTSLNTQRGDVFAMAQIFDEIYPTMDLMGNILTDPGQSIQGAWEQWTRASDRAAESVFQLTGYQLADLAQNSGELNSHIDRLLSTPEGQMQALQASNNLTALQLEEMRKLRELMATATQAQVMAHMKDEKKEQLAKEIWQEMHRTDLLIKQYEAYE